MPIHPSAVVESFLPRMWTAAAVTVIFALLARLVRGVSFSGSVAGAVVCFILYAGAGRGAFAVLIVVFVLTWLATRFGYWRKQKLGTAESREGRNASQVLANLAIASACAAFAAFTGKAAFLVAMAAALCEAAADTVSSELGQSQTGYVRLITTWETVPVGTDGGISGIGTAGGIVAAIVVSSASSLARLIPSREAPIAALAGIVGMIIDSYLGALLERRKLLNNNWVNFLSTLFAAGIAFLLARV
ncbi:MAG: DUF92 domain-containing protein [Acidobacteriaceae bacterium]|nr:DUF92 domain-containing protein [Acidobacteriaceae bacterium]